MDRSFLIARNPDPHSRLPYLLRVPLEAGLVLKAKDTWPRTARVFCLQSDDAWPEDAELLESLPVRSCRRRGVAVDLLLERSRMNQSQFVFTTTRGGRPVVFWQTPKTARASRPGVRVPTRRASGQRELSIVVDSRERYGYRFAAQKTEVKRRALECGDYAVLDEDGEVLAAVERKTVPDLVAGLVDGSLQFALAELAELPRAAVVIEGEYGDLFDVKHVQPGFVLDLLARLQVRFSSVPLVFATSRKLAEEYTYRFLGAAKGDLSSPLEDVN